MAPFYEELKSLREKQGIDLEEIHNRTKINLETLQAIESGQFDILPTPYIRLFIKAYVIEIGGDTNETLNQLEHHLNLMGRESSGESKRKRIRKSSGLSPESDQKHLPPKPSRSLRSTLIKILPIVIIWFFAIIIFYKIYQVPENTDFSEQNIVNGTNYISEEKLLTDYKLEKSDEKAILSISTEITPPFSVKIIPSQSVEYLVKEDTLPSQQVVKKSGEVSTFLIKRRLDILLNHTLGIKVTLNGEPLDDIASQPYPLRITLLSDPPILGTKYYIPID
ncbi:MAG TPA: helix-turn-helix domain-containing protein [Candidatus Marinimicrobia bacterium]|nr:helix-turn-helix domain-containing protein [Candidatus Neomarinimicrobiota bacterium]